MDNELRPDGANFDYRNPLSTLLLALLALWVVVITYYFPHVAGQHHQRHDGPQLDTDTQCLGASELSSRLTRFPPLFR